MTSANDWAFYERHFATARLQHYLTWTNGDQVRAMLLYRWNVGTSPTSPTLKIGIAFNKASFTIDKTDAPDLDIPNVSYTYLSPGVAARIPFGPRFAGIGKLHYFMVSGLGEVAVQYRDALRRAGETDFDDQVIGAIERLLADPPFRRRAQRAARILLVDEFQDLTPAHLLLLRLLSGPAGGVFGVGDDDQTIYGYNGADPSWLIDFGTWFPGAGDHPLQVNYRCPAGVVEVATSSLRAS